MSDQTITLRYSCPECGIKGQEVAVRLRGSSEDLITWFEGVAIAGVCADHKTRAPHCHPQQLHDVMIPALAGSDFIGGPVQH